MNRPKIQEDFSGDTERLAELCESYIDACEEGTAEDSDIPAYIFEAALEMVFGEDVWDYVNAKL